MKKTIKGALLFVLGALCAIGVYMFAGDNESLEIYLEQTLVPNAVLALSSAGGILAAAYPIVSKITEALSKFGIATEKVTLTADDGRALAESVKEYKEELLTQLHAELDSYKTELTKSISELSSFKEQVLVEVRLLEAGEDDIKKMLLLGFGNTDELVKKGFARDIAKVVEGNGGKEG